MKKRVITEFLVAIAEVAELTLKTVYFVFKGIITFSINLTLLFAQMAMVGWESLPIISVTGFFTGAVLVLQTGLQFKKFGADSYIGGVVALALARELAPVLSAIVISGRVGAALAAEIGTMNVTEQIDALHSLATSPINYLVVPRFLACIFMLPILTIYTNFIGTVGGCIAAVYEVNISLVTFKDSVLNFLELRDLFGGLFKAAFFGMIISIIGCYKGFTTTGGAEGVGKSTTSSVVTSIMLILISNYFLSSLIFNVKDSVIR